MLCDSCRAAAATKAVEALAATYIHSVFVHFNTIPFFQKVLKNILENKKYILFQNVSYNGSLLPHLPGGSQQGSPDMRLAASNLSLGSHNGNTKVNNKYDNHPHHLPTI